MEFMEILNKAHDTTQWSTSDIECIKERRFFNTREYVKPVLTRHFTDGQITVIAEPIEAHFLEGCDWRITWENILTITN